MAEIASQDGLYEEAARDYSAALERLARAYEADSEVCRDLLQDIHVALWRSFGNFNGACSLRTWIYRVAHNTAMSHVTRERRRKAGGLVSLEEVEAQPCSTFDGDRQHQVNQLMAMVRQLKPMDRQVILAYLEDLDAAAIGEITGLSASNVATKIHRIKKILSRRFHAEYSHE